MNKYYSVKCLLLCLLLIGGIINAQDGYQLNGRSAIGLNMGMFSGSKSSSGVIVSGVTTEVRSTGFAGNLFFKYWLQENLALKLSAGMLTGSADVKTNLLGSTTQTSAVMPLTLGLNYYFLGISYNNAIRPFLSGAMGMYVGSEASNSMLSTKVHTENAFGGRVGGGVDFILGNHFSLGINFGYNLMSDFSSPVGGNKNYNGADFTLQFEYIF